MTKSLFRRRDSLALLPHYTSSGLIIAKSYSELLYAVLCTDCFLSSKKRQLLNADLNWNLSTFVFIFHLNVNCKLVNVSVDNLRLDPWPALNIHVFSFSNEIGEFCPFPLNWSTGLIEMSKCYIGGIGACVSGSKKYQRVTQEKLIQIWKIGWDFSCKLRKDG